MHKVFFKYQILLLMQTVLCLFSLLHSLSCTSPLKKGIMLCGLKPGSCDLPSVLCSLPGQQWSLTPCLGTNKPQQHSECLWAELGFLSHSAHNSWAHSQCPTCILVPGYDLSAEGQRCCCEVVKFQTRWWGHDLDPQDRLGNDLAKCWTSQELAPSLAAILKPLSSSRSTFSRLHGLLTFFLSVASLLRDGFSTPPFSPFPSPWGKCRSFPGCPSHANIHSSSPLTSKLLAWSPLTANKLTEKKSDLFT